MQLHVFLLPTLLHIALAIPAPTPTATPSPSSIALTTSLPTAAITLSSSAQPSTVTTSNIATTTPYTDGDPSAGPGNAIDNSGGAGGSDADAWALSKGAIAAISVVVGLVATFGIASTVLWYVAKKRHWEVRKSLKRVSRRLTGRKANEEEDRQALRRSKRAGLVTVDPTGKLARDLEKGSGKKEFGKVMEIEMKEGRNEKKRIFPG